MNILVFAEQHDGSFKKAAFESVVYGASVAAATSGNLITLVMGSVSDETLNQLSKYGASRIIAVKNSAFDRFETQSFASAIKLVADHVAADWVIISNTYTGKAIAPALAVKMNAGLNTGIISLPQASGSEWLVRKPVFSGKAFANISLSAGKQVLNITPNSFSVIENPQSAAIESMDINPAPAQTQSLELSLSSGKVVLTEAEVVVSGGRGMKGPENWHLIEKLADTLGAATACSKPVSDMHWRPHSEHVGQTGITIKPNLYFAIGISGAIQHLAGVNSSKVIVAINKDPEAPFFKAADFGIIGDALEIIPKLTEAAEKLKA